MLCECGALSFVCACPCLDSLDSIRVRVTAIVRQLKASSGEVVARWTCALKNVHHKGKIPSCLTQNVVSIKLSVLVTIFV
jgi:hypothetical protein